MIDLHVGRQFHHSIDNHVLNAAEFLVVYQGNSRIFIFIIEGQLLTVNLVPFLVEFFNGRFRGKVGNDLVDCGFDLLW